MQYARSCSTPMTSGKKLFGYGSDQVLDAQQYLSIVGGLQYLMVTRPEISFSIDNVSVHALSTTISLVCSQTNFTYLAGTVDTGLELTLLPHYNLTCFSDAHWGLDSDDRRSTSDYCVFLGSNLVSWSSKKHHTISCSTAEAKFRSLAKLAYEVT